MGEVKIKVKLTNGIDRALLSRCLLSPEQVRATGAVYCVLPPYVVQHLGLDIVSQRVAEYADGRQEAVGITDVFLVEIMGRDEFENAIVVGDEVLIDQTALEKMDLLVDCTAKGLIPNPAHPDRPVSKIK